MKIYERIVIDLASGETLEESSYTYQGPVALCIGGGSGGGSSTQTVQQRADPWSGVQPYLLGTAPTASRQPYAFGTGPRVLRPSNSKYITETDESDSGRKTRRIMLNPDYDESLNSQPEGPGIPGILPEAARLYSDYTPQYFPGSSVAPFSPEQQAAMSLTTRRALTGSGLNRSAESNINSTLRGDFLYGNPGFNAAFDAAANRIIPRIDSGFATAGRYGSGLADTAKYSALGDAFAGLYGQERGNQMQAAGMAPALAAQDYVDYGQLGQVGYQRQAQAQSNIDDQIARHEFEQNMPYYKLGQYQNFINPVLGVGGSQTTTQPMYRNRAAGMLGGAATGAGIAGGLTQAGMMTAGSPWGWGLLGAGALLGGL